MDELEFVFREYRFVGNTQGNNLYLFMLVKVLNLKKKFVFLVANNYIRSFGYATNTWIVFFFINIFIHS